jgi:hypothetical protein
MVMSLRHVAPRRPGSAILTTLVFGFGCAPLAQAQLNPLDHHDGVTEFLDPGNVSATETGYVCDRWMLDHYLGGLREITRLRISVQDQNCATREPMQFAIFGEALDAGGQRTGLPRESSPVLLTAMISGPGCPTGQSNGNALWEFTFTGPGGAPVAVGPFTTDRVTGFLREGDATWPNTDGLAGVASVAGVTQGLNPEQPSPRMLTAFNAASSGWPRNIQRMDFVSGSGGGAATRLSPVYCTGDEIDVNGLVAKIGSRDTNNTWSLNTNLGSDNFGFAGRFPDPRNLNATNPARRDSPVFDVSHGSSVRSGLCRIFLSERTAVAAFGQQIELAGIGTLALDPTGTLFTASASDLFGLTRTFNGGFTYFVLDLTALQARPVFQPGQRFYAQALDINLTTGQGALSNLMSWEIF